MVSGRKGQAGKRTKRKPKQLDRKQVTAYNIGSITSENVTLSDTIDGLELISYEEFI